MARIDHTACTHPRTPAGRKACRNAPITLGSIAREMFTTPDPIGTPALTPAADASVDRVVAALDNAFKAIKNQPTIETPAGKIRAGSVVEVRIAGEAGLIRGKLDEVSDDIKNGYPGCTSMTADRPFWVYADQVVRVVTF